MNRSLVHRIVLALAVVGAAFGCKSKLEKCTGVCTDIREREESACSGDSACLVEARAKSEMCRGLCESAVSAGTQTRPRGGDTPVRDTLAARIDPDETEFAKGDGEACARAGGRFLVGAGGRTRDEARAVPLLKRSCELRSGAGCDFYGRALHDGRGVPPDLGAAQEAFAKACDLNEGSGCRSVALRFPTSDPKRIPFLEKACALDDGIGCMGLAAAYLHGNQGAPKDLQKSRDAFEKSCKLGTQRACDMIAQGR
jgi:TPR repeat protein